MIDNECVYLETVFEYYGISLSIPEKHENVFYKVFQVVPNKNCTIAKIKKALPDIQAVTQRKLILDTSSGIQLKQKKENRNIIYSCDFFTDITKNNRPEKIPLAFGIDENGNKIFYDLVKLPHLLVAGTTGSGKSVFVHNCILSELYSGKSAIILIDVKKVEFSLYEGIPQLSANIAYSSKQACNLLKNLCFTMDNRYKLLRDSGCRNIDEFQKFGKMQYITCFIDELADCILQYPDIEQYLVRLCQLGRAAGIHLIVSTQRPDAKILSGLIRINLPSRVCFSVQKSTDSRIILDQSGGENLKGNGDGLFLPIGTKEPIHFQSAFTSTSAIKQIVEICKKSH